VERGAGGGHDRGGGAGEREVAEQGLGGAGCGRGNRGRDGARDVVVGQFVEGKTFRNESMWQIGWLSSLPSDYSRRACCRMICRRLGPSLCEKFCKAPNQRVITKGGNAVLVV
jgi:hypothetical protein